MPLEAMPQAMPEAGGYTQQQQQQQQQQLVGYDQHFGHAMGQVPVAAQPGAGRNWPAPGQYAAGYSGAMTSPWQTNNPASAGANQAGQPQGGAGGWPGGQAGW